MRNIARLTSKILLYVTAVLIVTASIITVMLELNPSWARQLRLFEFELNMFKVIVAGFVVSMLGILIPAVAIETREQFERRKESRIAYSEAKTGVDYLKLRLAAVNLAEAENALRGAHFQKHQAELFDEFTEWLEKRYDGKMTADQWNEMMYAKLFRARQVLENNAETWDKLNPAQRIALLDHALPTRSEIEITLFSSVPH